MIIKKILETRIDLLKTEHIYTQNINDILMKKLRQKYINICYKSCYIIKINKIIKRSLIRISSQLNGLAYVNVNFEVNALIYNPNEIITNAKIINKDPNGRIQCKTNFCSIEVKQDYILNTYSKGHYLPIIVLKSRYIYGKDKISIMGRAFKPIIKKNIIYYCKNNPTEEELENLKIIFDNINEIYNNINIKSIQQNKLNFFSNLLYPFKEEKDFLSILKDNIINNSEIKKISINYNDIKKLGEGFYILPNEINKLKKEFYFIKYKKISVLEELNELFDIVEQNFISIIEQFLNEYISFISSINNLAKTYYSPKLINQNKLLFQYYKSKKNN